jgi:hypothetical protein
MKLDETRNKKQETFQGFAFPEWIEIRRILFFHVILELGAQINPKSAQVLINLLWNTTTTTVYVACILSIMTNTSHMFGEWVIEGSATSKTGRIFSSRMLQRRRITMSNINNSRRYLNSGRRRHIIIKLHSGRKHTISNVKSGRKHTTKNVNSGSRPAINNANYDWLHLKMTTEGLY